MRLEITKKCDLAMESLRVLSEQPTRMKGSDLAQRLGTTSGFLSQALTPLVRKSIVASDPGPTGGYSLTRELKDISVLDVIETIEGPTVDGRCVLAEQPCDENNKCALHHAWVKARAQLLVELESTSVLEAFDESENKQKNRKINRRK